MASFLAAGSQTWLVSLLGAELAPIVAFRKCLITHKSSIERFTHHEIAETRIRRQPSCLLRMLLPATTALRDIDASAKVRTVTLDAFGDSIPGIRQRLHRRGRRAQLLHIPTVVLQPADHSQ